MKKYLYKDCIRRKKVSELEIKRNKLKYIFKNHMLPLNIRLEAQSKLNKLPRNGSIVRIKNYCVLTGRSKGVYKLFRLSRIKFRELALTGLLPGVIKASW
jgi:small subunit ribosomal protein S14